MAKSCRPLGLHQDKVDVPDLESKEMVTPVLMSPTETVPCASSMLQAGKGPA